MRTLILAISLAAAVGCAGSDVTPQTALDAMGHYTNAARELFLAQCEGDANAPEPAHCVKMRVMYDQLAGYYQQLVELTTGQAPQ